MEIKMSRSPFTVAIIGGILDRSKVIYFQILRDNDNSTRMLASGTFCACTSFYKTIGFGVFVDKLFIRCIPFDIAVRCFLCDGADRTCSVDIVFTEKNFCVIMGYRLILTGEVEIDIRYVVAFKTEKCFQWNV